MVNDGKEMSRLALAKKSCNKVVSDEMPLEQLRPLEVINEAIRMDHLFITCRGGLLHQLAACRISIPG